MSDTSTTTNGSLVLGVRQLSSQELLAAPNLRGLRRLTVGETATKKLDLEPVCRMPDLEELGIVGQEHGIDAVGQCRRLSRLFLTGISHKRELEFVNAIPSLRSLAITFGSRVAIDEIRNPAITEVELLRVRGLARFDPEAFPKLERLSLEDLAQLERLSFGKGASRLEEIRLLTCKKLSQLNGLESATKLRSLRISSTALELEPLLEQVRALSLRTFAFYTHRAKADAAIRARLDAAGYLEFPAEVTA